MAFVPLVVVGLLATAPGVPEKAPALLVSARPVGLGAEAAAAVSAKLDTELADAGVAFTPAAAPVDESCLSRPACVAGRLTGAPALLHVELLRVGPFVQVRARLYGADGEELASHEESAEAEGFPAGAPLLDAALLDAARDVAPAAIARTETEVIEVAPVEQPKAPAPSPVLAYGGIGVAVAGGLLTLGGGVLALHEASVLDDAASLGDDKARARVLGPVALGAAAAGVLVLGAGGALSSLAFSE